MLNGFQENKDLLDLRLHVDVNFDLLTREITEIIDFVLDKIGESAYNNRAFPKWARKGFDGDFEAG